MKQCAKGHVYDANRFSTCPYCDGIGSAGVSFNSQAQSSGKDFPATGAISSSGQSNPGNFPPTRGFDITQPGEPKMGVTEYIGDIPVRPTVGWLVVVEGEKKGLSYPIYTQMNYIGRGAEYSINLDDKTISSDGDAVIAYNAKKQGFYICQTNHNKNTIYLNDDVILGNTEMKDYDKIEIGTTVLRFRSFCNSEFNYL